MKEFVGFVCSIVGAASFILGLAVAQSQNETHVLGAMEWIGYGLAVAAGPVLIITGFRLAGPRALVVDAAVLVFFFACVYPAVFSSSRGRGLQIRTMADIRSLATALEARATERNEYPTIRSVNDLVQLLEPTYIKPMPRTDGWGNAWRYESWKEDPKSAGPDHYALGSGGRDNKFEKASLRQYSKTATTDFDGDLVVRDGVPISWPQGRSY